MSEPRAATRKNRSTEEFEMRDAIATWGRAIWPNARVVHELVVANECRIDMAFIEPDNIVGIEIKSSRDTLDRLENQMRVFRTHLPLVVVAVAPKWLNDSGWFTAAQHAPDWITCVDGTVERGGYLRRPRREITTQMLDLLWADEARAIAARKRITHSKSEPRYSIIPMIARALTGDEIVNEVCRALRARDAFPKLHDHPKSDPPIYVESANGSR